MKLFRRVASLVVLVLLGALAGAACTKTMKTPQTSLSPNNKPNPTAVRTIQIVNCRVDPQMQDAVHANAVAWNNQDASPVTVQFAAGFWPFNGSQTDITVPAGGTSAQFTLSPSIHSGTFKYSLSCAAAGRGALPDSVIGPGVIVDD